MIKVSKFIFFKKHNFCISKVRNDKRPVKRTTGSWYLVSDSSSLSISLLQSSGQVPGPHQECGKTTQKETEIGKGLNILFHIDKCHCSNSLFIGVSHPELAKSLLANVSLVSWNELANVCIGKCSIYISRCHKIQPKQKIGECLD